MREQLPAESQDFLSECQETFVHREGHQALLQVAQKGCGVSIVGDTKNPSGHGPAQPALGGPA